MRWREKIKDAGLAMILPVLLVMLWFYAAEKEWCPPQLLVPPQQVMATFVDLFKTGELAGHLQASFLRVVEGFAAGAVAGLSLGVLLGLSRRADTYIGPLFHGMRQVPIMGWVPIFMVWFGIGEVFKLVFIALGVFYILTINTYEGIRGVPNVYVEVARVFEYSRLRLLWRVILPAASPSIFTGIRFALGMAWMSVVGAELIASETGIGYMMTWGRQLFQIDVVMVGIFVIGFVGLVMDAGMGLLEKYVLRWRRVY